MQPSQDSRTPELFWDRVADMYCQHRGDESNMLHVIDSKPVSETPLYFTVLK